MKFHISALLLFQLAAAANGYKFLAIFSMSSKSHLFSFLPLANELASRGHELTIMHSYPKLAMASSIKTITIPAVAELMEKSMGDKAIDRNMSGWAFMSQMKTLLGISCRLFLESEETQALLKAGKQFDAVIALSGINDCGMAIAPLLGKHLIVHHPVAVFFMFPSPGPHPPSIIPNPMFYYPSKMNFQERFMNFVSSIFVRVAYQYYIISEASSVLKELVPEAPTVWESWHNASLTIVNQDVITSSPRPLVPNVISAPGMPCVPAKPLPSDLEQFMQTSGDDGVILVGLGSVAKSSLLPPEVIQKFLTIFGRLKQKVIWKFEDDSLKVPPNVKILKWMPQQDILGHPKTKLFISHGGLASMQESVYHGVPVIGVPLYGDQPGNVVRMKEIGVGDYVDLFEVSAEEFHDIITGILNDQSYYDRMKKYSAIFRDHLQPPVKKAAFWVEYVVRHNGARHLRTVGQDMCFFQYFLIDVIAVLTLVPLLSLYTFYRVVKFAWRKHKACQRKKTDASKKTQ